MTTLLLIASLAFTAVVGAGSLFAAMRRRAPMQHGRLALIAGTAYPLGALLMTAWMWLLSTVNVSWSRPVVIGPPLLLLAFAAWRWRHRLTANRGRDVAGALAGRTLSGAGRWLWFGLIAWLTLRIAFLAGEILARPPLPWEAWLHAAGRAHVWHALGGPVAFVPEAAWRNAGGYLEGLPVASPLTPWLDAWTITAVGAFDDTTIHAPWLLYWLCLPLLGYALMRMHGAGPLRSLGMATLIATLPLPNAHAALGGTAALPLAAYYLAAFAFAQRGVRSWVDAALISGMLAGMLASGGIAGAIWASTLLPLALSRASATWQSKGTGALVAAAVLAAVVVARDGTGDAATPHAASAAALGQHLFLLGNWHLLAYAALAMAVVAWRAWRAPPLLTASGVVALGTVALLVFTMTAPGRALVGVTVDIGTPAVVFGPLLATWTALVAHRWLERAADIGDAPDGKGVEPPRS